MAHSQRGRVHFTVLVLVTGWLLPVSPSRACALVWNPAWEGGVALAGEEAIIVWNAEAGIQHFIRRAEFRTQADDFGFLVPTPGRPELAEADNGAFGRISDATRPEEIWKYNYKFKMTLYAFFNRPVSSIFANVDAALPSGSVEVLEQVQVAGYDATVLRADDAQALLDWLNDHGYSFQPEMAAWLKPYTDEGWIVTAFKYSKETKAQGTSVGTKAVRMSFAAERPFFPYREPAGQVGQPRWRRSLRIYLVSDTRMLGTLGPEMASWGGETLYAKRRSDLSTLLEGALPRDQIKRGMWLTSFLDKASTRPDDGDLFFEATDETEPVIPPPIIKDGGTREIPLCLDVIFAAGVTGLALRARRRRKGQVT